MKMNRPEEFLRHAADCKLMARFAQGRADKAMWNRMAERWMRCAELFMTESLAAQQQAPAERDPARIPKFAHH
jgi:hypothetical protein